MTDSNVRIASRIIFLAGIVLLVWNSFAPGIISGAAASLLVLLLSGFIFLRPNNPPSPEAKPEQHDTPQLAQKLQVTVSELASAVEAINEVASSQSEGSTEQGRMLMQTSILIDDFLALSDQVSDRARIVIEISDQTTQAADGGQHAIEMSIAGMEQIRQQVAVIAETIATLARLTRRIDTIITSVGEIATQSNLLALNASIEAARAGVHGQGFAVVADEVRLLAGQSTQAASEVRTLLREVQSAITETIDATQLGMNEVNNGVLMTKRADQAMRQISEEISNSHEATRDIYDGIRQQIQNLESITINVERVNQINHENVTGLKVIQTVSSNLTRLSNELQLSLKT